MNRDLHFQLCFGSTTEILNENGGGGLQGDKWPQEPGAEAHSGSRTEDSCHSQPAPLSGASGWSRQAPTTQGATEILDTAVRP